MDNKKKKKTALILKLFGTLIMVGVFIAMFIVMFTFEDIDLMKVLIPTMSGFVVGLAIMLSGVVVSAKIKNAEFYAAQNSATQAKNVSTTTSEPVPKAEPVAVVNNAVKETKIYPVEVPDKRTILAAWAMVALLLVSLTTTILLFAKGFSWWMLVLVAIIIAGFVFLGVDLKKFKASQTQVDKWNDAGEAGAQQYNTPHVEMTLEKANKGFKNKFYFWMTKNKASVAKTIVGILSCVVVGIVVLASIFTGFGAVVNPVGAYKYDYSNTAGYGDECYAIITLNDDNTYEVIDYYYGNKSKSEIGTWKKSGSSLYAYAQKRFNAAGTLTWTLNPNATYPELTNYDISLTKIISGTTVWIKK